MDHRAIDVASLKPRLERAFEFAARQVRGTIERHPDYFPIYTAGGRWYHKGELWTDWCAGFHAGMMWLIAGRTGDPWWRKTAEHYSRLLEHRQHDRNVHDLGFIFLNTYLPWYRATGDDHLRQVLITAGQTLALRFNPKGQYLRSFVAPESLFIDIMMNVPHHLLRGAGRPTTRRCTIWPRPIAGPPSETLVRPDGSTAHEGIFDLDTGEFLRQSTHQGLRADSAWTRGLAWSLYGFGTVYTLHATTRPTWPSPRRNADYYLERSPDEPGSSLGLRRSRRPRPDRRQLGRRDRRVGLLEPGRAGRRQRSRPSARYREAALTILDSPLHRRLSRLERSRLGRRRQARRLSFPQEARRRRVGHVGRFLLPGGREPGLEPMRCSKKLPYFMLVCSSR